MDKYIGDIVSRIKKEKDRQPITALMPYIAAAEGLITIEKWLDKRSEKVESKITDELKSAEEYLETYEKTKDPDYLDMAHDETRHAKKLISEESDAGESAEVDKMIEWHNNILERIEEHKNESPNSRGYRL